MTHKAKRYIKGRGIRKVSLLPDILFRLKGRIDAKRTSTFANENIDKLIYTTDGLINKEILRAQEILHPVREEAAQLIASIQVSKNAIKELPLKQSDTFAVVIRSNKQLNSAIRSNMNSLSVINEFIITVTDALKKRIKTTQILCRKKKSAYVIGLLSGGMSDYKYEVNFQDTSFKNYIESHEKLDNKIKALLEESENKKNEAF